MKEENQRQKDWKERDTRLSPETVQTDSTGEMLSQQNHKRITWHLHYSQIRRRTRESRAPGTGELGLE